MSPVKIAAIATHPIQYQTPLWKKLAGQPNCTLDVYFASRHGLETGLDREFGTRFAWDIPLLEGYRAHFCRSIRIPLHANPVATVAPLDLPYRIGRGNYDAVLVHGYATATSWIGITSAWASRIPIIMRGDTHSVGRAQSTTAQRAKELVLPHALRHVDGFLAIGSWNAEYWVSMGVPAERIRVAIYSVDNDRLSEQVRLARDRIIELRKKWRATEHETVFLFVAKLLQKKAPDDLLEAFVRLNDSHARLVIVGTGPMEAALRELGRKLEIDVFWEGFVNQSELAAYYAAADVLVLPSHFEPWGLVVNEAMACGTPCIVSNVVGAGPDLIAGRDTGRIFSSGGIDDLQRCLREALQPEVRAIWKANVSKVIDEAHPRHFVRELLALVDEVRQRRQRDGA